MAKICFGHYLNGKYDSLEQAYRTLKGQDGWYDYLLAEIVQYNVCYRDYLRNYGLEALIERLVEEVPELEKENGSFAYLKEWLWDYEGGRIADYDIQYYHIKDQVTILGHTFNGLEDVTKHRTILGIELYNGFKCYRADGINEYPDVHIGELYQPYPVFDSYDAGDNRCYQNFIFSTKPITKDDMSAAFEMPHEGNFCMAHENIPIHRLPILYYQGDGGYMLLATSKDQ